MRKSFRYAVEYLHTLRKVINSEILGGLTVYNFSKGKNVSNERKIRYSNNNDLYLNIYEPKNRTDKKLPVFLYLHGGGWIVGSPEGREGFTTNLASKGYFVISLFYGLSPKYHHPAPIEHAYAALEWLIDNEFKYNIDLSSIIVGGESAGAHLSAIMGAISTNPDYKALFNLPKASRDIKIRALVLNCGVYEIAKALDSGFKHIKVYVESYYGKPLKYLATDAKAKEMSPIYYVTPNFPRSYIISAENDKLAPSSFAFIETLEKNNVEYKHYHGIGKFAVHAFPVAQVLNISKEVMDGITEFLQDKKDYVDISKEPVN